MDRRKFIKSTGIACAGSIAAMWLFDGCTSTKYVTNFNYSQNKITVKKTEFVVLKNERKSHRKFVLLKAENLEFPIVVYQIRDDLYKALYLQCTHQGCELTPYETTMVCPCHGAEFNNEGVVTQGPAEINLKTFTTSHDHENIYIHL